MTFQFIIDENIPLSVIPKLKDYNYEVLSIRLDYPGVKNSEIIKISNQLQQPIITMDKDFGFYVFKQKMQPYCVILLRIHSHASEKIIATILQIIEAIEKNKIELQGKFLVFDGKSLRIRKLI